jgi:hypothetical protein
MGFKDSEIPIPVFEVQLEVSPIDVIVTGEFRSEILASILRQASIKHSDQRNGLRRCGSRVRNTNRAARAKHQTAP